MLLMDADAAFAVVDAVLRFGFAETMDEATAELGRLGWEAAATDGDGTCIDQQWEYPPSRNLWRVHTGRAGAEFFVGLIVNTEDEASARELVDQTRSVVERWSASTEWSHVRSVDSSDIWSDAARVITLRLLPGTHREVGKSVPPALQFTVENVEPGMSPK